MMSRLTLGKIHVNMKQLVATNDLGKCFYVAMYMNKGEITITFQVYLNNKLKLETTKPDKAIKYYNELQMTLDDFLAILCM